MTTIYFVLISLATLVMLCALAMVIRLRKIARGGKVGRTVNLMAAFVVLFLIGYAAGPWLPRLGQEYSLLLTSVVFLFGAIFVILVLALIKRLIQQVFEELDMQ